VNTNITALKRQNMTCCCPGRLNDIPVIDVLNQRIASLVADSPYTKSESGLFHTSSDEQEPTSIGKRQLP